MESSENSKKAMRRETARMKISIGSGEDRKNAEDSRKSSGNLGEDVEDQIFDVGEIIFVPR